MSPTSEARRRTLFELLDRARTQKLIVGGAPAALRLLREAEALLEESPQLCDAPRALIAYRLGHLLLRCAPDREALLEADQCLSQAARSPALGPWPQIYRLAALGRLRAVADSARERTLIGAQIDRARAAALRSIDEAAPETVQEGAFNALELATYVLALPYSPLEGRAVRARTEMAEGARLVGPDPLTARVWMSLDSCCEELDQRGALEPGSLLFRLGREAPRAQARLAADSDWDEMPLQVAQVLAILLSEPRPTRQRVAWCLYGDTDSVQPAARLRQALSRCRRWLKSRLGIPGAILQGPDGLRLVAGARIYGVVERDALS